MSSQILDNVYSKKDTHLFRHFCGAKDERQQHDSDEEGSHPLDTKEVDMKALLSHPVSDRAQMFYDKESCDQVQAVLESTKPWVKDANYFRNVHVSSLALLKMTMHAKSGGSIEVMGMLTGRIVNNGIVVMDVYPLPVEGTETRVNAQAEGYEFMVQYLDSLRKSGRHENIVGWYHSHPGYGCWLSGIDVSTQSLNQQFQDPYLAIVVDPIRTTTNGLVEIGAFRTYSEKYIDQNTNQVGSLGSLGISPSNAKRSKETLKKKGGKSANIPEEKIKDFGMHASKYYSLSIEVFRSAVDHMILSNLWNKFWISSLVNNGSDEQEQRLQMEQFLNDKLTDLEHKLDGIKKAELKSSNAERNARKNAKLGSVHSPDHQLVDRWSPREQHQQPRDPLNLMGRIQSQVPEKFGQSSLQKSQLSPFTKANLLSRMGKEAEDSDGSDSEMNDVDSDLDMVQDAEERMHRRKNEAFQSLSRNRKQGSRSSAQRSNLDSSGYDPLVAKKRKQSDKMMVTAAEASRNLMKLKMQEILFLNED